MRVLVVVLSVLVIGLAGLVGYLLGQGRGEHRRKNGAAHAEEMAEETEGGAPTRGTFAPRVRAAPAGAAPLAEREIQSSLAGRGGLRERAEAFRQLAARDVTRAQEQALNYMKDPELFEEAARLFAFGPAVPLNRGRAELVIETFEGITSWPDDATRAAATGTVLGLLKETGHDRLNEFLERAAHDRSPEVRQAALLQASAGVEPAVAVPLLFEGLGDQATASIARSGLSGIAGRDLGPDRAAWEAWWKVRQEEAAPPSRPAQAPSPAAPGT